MRPRTALIAVVALALAAPAPAMAAAKKKKPAPLPKVCNLLTDASDDGEKGLIKSPALDILSADIATGKGELVAVLRLASADTKNDHFAKLGYEWVFGATANGARYLFKVKRTASAQSERDTSTVSIGSLTNVKHDFKIINGTTFEWRVKRSEVAPMARPGLYWSLFSATSEVFGGSADSTDPTPKRYIDRQPSCLVAG